MRKVPGPNPKWGINLKHSRRRRFKRRIESGGDDWRIGTTYHVVLVTTGGVLCGEKHYLSGALSVAQRSQSTVETSEKPYLVSRRDRAIESGNAMAYIIPIETPTNQLIPNAA